MQDFTRYVTLRPGREGHSHTNIYACMTQSGELEKKVVFREQIGNVRIAIKVVKKQITKTKTLFSKIRVVCNFKINITSRNCCQNFGHPFNFYCPASFAKKYKSTIDDSLW